MHPTLRRYFLITPKLLLNLAYSERMKILCVYNGEYVASTRAWTPRDAPEHDAPQASVPRVCAPLEQ